MNILRREKVSQQHRYFKLEPDFSLNSQNLSSLKNTFLDTTQSTLSQRKDCTQTETNHSSGKSICKKMEKCFHKEEPTSCITLQHIDERK